MNVSFLSASLASSTRKCKHAVKHGARQCAAKAREAAAYCGRKLSAGFALACLGFAALLANSQAAMAQTEGSFSSTVTPPDVDWGTITSTIATAVVASVVVIALAMVGIQIVTSVFEYLTRRMRRSVK